MDEKFVLTGIDYEDAKVKKNLVDQFKTSLKKFQGRQTVSGEEKVRYDPALVSQVTQVLISEGWKKPANIKTRRRSNTDPGLPPSESQKSKYKGKKNPLSRKDGSQLKCFKCQSEYHFIDSCPKLTDKEKERGDSAFTMCVTSSNVTGSDEYVMIAKTKEELCLLVEEAGVKGVIDSACSKTVAGNDFITKYIDSLPENTRSSVNHDGEPSTTVFQFGGGERRSSLKKMAIPAVIGDIKLKIETEIVNADIPLLIGANSLEKAKAVLDFGNSKATFFTTEVPLLKVKSGHYCINLLSEKMDSHVNDGAEREEIVLHAIEASTELSHKELQKLHHLCGHTSTDRIWKLIKNAGREEKDTKQILEKIKESCETCQKSSRAVPRPKFAIPRADKFNQIVTIDLKDFDKTGPQKEIHMLSDRYAHTFGGSQIYSGQTTVSYCGNCHGEMDRCWIWFNGKHPL